MHTKKAMQDCNIRYFSKLTPKQKDKSVKLAVQLVFNDFSPVLLPIYMQIEKPCLNGCKMFYHEQFKTWIPLNISEIIKNARN